MSFQTPRVRSAFGRATVSNLSGGTKATRSTQRLLSARLSQSDSSARLRQVIFTAATGRLDLSTVSYLVVLSERVLQQRLDKLPRNCPQRSLFSCHSQPVSAAPHRKAMRSPHDRSQARTRRSCLRSALRWGVRVTAMERAARDGDTAERQRR